MKSRSILTTLSAMLLMAAINLAASGAFAGVTADALEVVTGCPPVAGWEEVGVGSACNDGISKTNKGSGLASLAIAPDSTPMVAWQNISASGSESEIYVRRFDGNAWVEMGTGSASGEGISNNNGNSRAPSLAIGPSGIAVVAWEDNSSGNREIYVRQFNGTSWVEMGTGSASGGGISKTSGASGYPSLAFGPDNTPVVAWEETTGSGVNQQTEIYVRQWDGSAWVEKGAGSASNGGISDPNNNVSNLRAYPSLAVGPDGAAVIAWQNAQFNADDWEVYVKRFNGTNWVEMGTGSASGEGISQNTGSSRFVALAVGPDNLPVIAWEDDSNRPEDITEIFVKRWNGTAWVEMGTGSAAGGGISDPNNNQNDVNAVPAVAVGPDGTTLIAWQHGELAGNDWEIYVRRWDGVAWGEISTGSASGGGISDNDGDSREPSLAIGPDNTPVSAWEDSSGENEEIYIRRYPIIVPVCYSLTRGHTGEGDDPVATPPNSDGCSVDRYYAGESITLTAAPATGWQVSGWTGTGNDSSNAVHNLVVMPEGDHSVSVIYEAICYPLTLNRVGQGGDPQPSPLNSELCPPGHYHINDSITLTAMPDENWQVVGWSGTVNDATTTITNTVMMPPGAHTAGVVYAADCFSLSLSHTGEGAVPRAIPSGSSGCFEGQYVAGEVLLLTAAPKAGWQVIGWQGTDDDSKQSALNSLTMPAANHLAAVNYAEIPKPVFTTFLPHVNSGGNGMLDR